MSVAVPGPSVQRAWLTDRPPRTFSFGQENVSVRVRESARATVPRIVLGPGRPLEIIVPQGLGDMTVDAILQEKRGWIAAKLRASRAIAERPHLLGLKRRGVVWLDGAAIPITRDPDGRPRAVLRDGTLVVGGADSEVGVATKRWYRGEARRRITGAVGQAAARLEVEYRSVTIRDQRTRWGSCSRHGNLSFSWRLVVPPMDVMEYVVVHELCHIRVPNHSKRFYRLLDAALPCWREQAGWLRVHGNELREF